MKRGIALALLMMMLSACGTDTPAVEPPGAEEVPVETPALLPEEEVEEVLAEEPEEPVEEPAEEEPEEPATAPIEGKAEPQWEKNYYVKINCQANTVTIYTKDETGGYTVPYMAMVCSTGTDTPQSGTYNIGYRWEWLGLFGDVFGYYVTQINGNILFHSVPYLEKYNPASLEYWEFDKLGTEASLGCIRLQVKDALWVYNHAGDIAAVEFYNDEDPGLLGKPTAPLISENELCRSWDPTDPNPENPWHAYLAENAAPEIDPETGEPMAPEGESETGEAVIPEEPGEAESEEAAGEDEESTEDEAVAEEGVSSKDPAEGEGTAEETSAENAAKDETAAEDSSPEETGSEEDRAPME